MGVLSNKNFDISAGTRAGADVLYGTTVGGPGKAILLLGQYVTGNLGATPINDDFTNIWTQWGSGPLEVTDAGNGVSMRVYVSPAFTGGLSHDVFLNNAATSVVAGVGFVISGLDTSAPLVTCLGNFDTSSPYSQPYTPTPGDNIHLASICWTNAGADTTFTVGGTGWTKVSGLENGTAASGQMFSVAEKNIPSSSGAAEDPSWTTSGGTSAAVFTMVFKNAAAGGGSASYFLGGVHEF
jgi:hypothetical protein